MTKEEFDATFSRSKSIKEFRCFYPNNESCFREFAELTSKKFSIGGPTCECCGGTANIVPRIATWEIHFQNEESHRQNLFGLALIFIGVVSLSEAVIRFPTQHSFCKRCLSAFSIKRLLTVPLSFLATIISYLPVIITVLGALYIVIGMFTAEKPSWVAWTVVAIAGVAIPVLFWVRRHADRLTIPTTIRSLAKDPMIYRGLNKELWRPNRLRG